MSRFRRIKAVFTALVLFCISACLFAATDDKFIEFLNQEKQTLSASLNTNTELLMPADKTELDLQRRENEVARAFIEAKINNLESFLSTQRKEQLAERNKKPSAADATDNLNSKTIDLLNENLQLATRYQKNLLAQRQQILNWQASLEEAEKLQDLDSRIDKLHSSSDAIYRNNLELQQEKASATDAETILATETRLLLNDHIIALMQLHITELNLERQRIKTDYQLRNNPDLKTIQAAITVYRQALEQYVTLEQALRRMDRLINHERELISDKSLRQRYADVNKTTTTRLAAAVAEQSTLQEKIEILQKQYKKQLSVRQTLSEYYSDNWPMLFVDLGSLSHQFVSAMKDLVMQAIGNYISHDIWHAAGFWIVLAITSFSGFWLYRLLVRLTTAREHSRLSAHLYGGILLLLRRNMLHLTVACSLIVTLALNNILFADYKFLVNLFAVWLLFRNLLIIARMMLLESVTDASGNDVRLYHRLKWILIAGGWSSAIVVFGNQFTLPTLLQDFLSRGFMLLLLVVSIVLWRSKDIIPYLLQPMLTSKKRYVHTVVNVLTILVPVTILTSAIIGFAGYINLAWTMIRYQFAILVVITGYILARGITFDLLEILSEWMISRLQNGWLWREVLLKPLDRLCSILLFATCGFFVLELIGFNSNSQLFNTLVAFGRQPVVNAAGIYITLFSIAEFVLLAYIFVWISRWIREFCYRWLYRDVKDFGIRNSLAVFTQYAVILGGGFITLHVLGLDFSGMSMILGGLAVGMGFGLRDFASNVIGGLMLLIERPVREGDLITLGEYEGRVSHIGLRSMRVSSWDNKEILIPNAETFNKPFINWTHQDDVVRTIIPVKVGRNDDPVMVQQLILDVLAMMEEILSDPKAEVFLEAIDEALITFQVRYYINVQNNSKFEVKSRVLFAITECFKNYGIEAPIPPYRIELKDNNLVSRSTKERERITSEMRED